MKKIKILILLICSLFITGCTVNYDLEITNTRFKEKTMINMSNSEYTEFSQDNNNHYFNMYYDDKNDLQIDGTEKPIEGVKYYDFKDYNTQVEYSGSFSYSDFKRSNAVTKGFNNVKVIDTDDELHLKTSKGFSFLYDNITSVTIRITTDYEVMYSNADRTSGNTQIWDINKSNAKNKAITLSLTKDKKSDNPTTQTPNTETQTTIESKKTVEPTTVILVIILIIAIALLLFLTVFAKSKNNNRI